MFSAEEKYLFLNDCEKFQENLKSSLTSGKNQAFIENCSRFHECRQSLEEAWEGCKMGIIDEIADVDLTQSNDVFNGMYRQQRLHDGACVQSLPELYATASVAQSAFSSYVMRLADRFLINTFNISIAPLKSIQRAAEKCKDDYDDRSPGPSFSWLFDIVRGSIICSNEQQIVDIIRCIEEESEEVQIIKLKNRFVHPTPGGFRDINVILRFPVKEGNGSEGVVAFHNCELQIHLEAIKDTGKNFGSHKVYEFLRKYFRGSVSAVERRMQLIEQVSIPSSIESAISTRAAISFDLVGIVSRSIETGRVGSDDEDKIESWLTLLDLMSEIFLIIELMRLFLRVLELVEGPSTARVVKLCGRLGLEYSSAGKHSEAKQMYERLRSGNAALFGEESIEVLLSDHHLAGLEHVLGHLEEADALMQSVDRRFNQYLSSESANEPIKILALNASHDYAMILFDMGRYQDARDRYNEVISGYEQLLGQNHPSTLRAIDNLAILLSKLREYDSAADCYLRAIKGYEKEYGPQNSTTLRVMNNYGSLLREKGDLDGALDVLSVVLAGYEAILPPDHNEVVMVVSNMANVYADKRLDEEALAMYKRVCTSREKNLGKLHPNTLRAYSNLACYYGNIGNYEEGIEVYKIVLKGREEVLGSSHLDTLLICSNMALSYSKLNRLEEAQELFQRVVTGRLAVVGRNHVITLQAYNCLGNNSCGLHLYEKAEQCFQEAVAGYLELFGPEHHQTKLNQNRLFAMTCHLFNRQNNSRFPRTATCPEHEHELSLVDSLYQTGHFACDLCSRNGYGWAYTCVECGFDIHPQCCSTLVDIFAQ